MNECALNIRCFKPIDMDKVLFIENNSFPENQRYDESIFNKLYVNSPDLFLVAEYCGEIIGYVIASHIEDFGHIISIAVHPEYRGRGFGSKLLEAIEEKLVSKGVKVIVLEVSVDNEIAVSMYKKHGYEPVAVLEKYYGDRDAILMVKYIRVKNTH